MDRARNRAGRASEQVMEATAGKRVDWAVVTVAQREEFSTLYEREFAPSVRLAVLLIGDGEAARDITQDAFVALHRRWRSVKTPRAYLRRSIVNGSRSWQRRQAVRRRLPLRAPEPEVQHPDELHDVLATLPERQRSAVVLRYFEQLSTDEIADVLDCRPGTVGSLLHRGLAALRIELVAEPAAPTEDQ